jgi:hypothetical protein
MLAPVDRLSVMPRIPEISVGKAAGTAAGLVTEKSAGTGGASGGYTFSPEEIDGIIRKWEDLLEELRADEWNAQVLEQVQPPGEEFASGDFHRVAKPSNQMAVEQYRRMQEYVKAYIEALRKAKEATQTTDENMQSDIAKAGQQS